MYACVHVTAAYLTWGQCKGRLCACIRSPGLHLDNGGAYLVGQHALALGDRHQHVRAIL